MIHFLDIYHKLEVDNIRFHLLVELSSNNLLSSISEILFPCKNSGYNLKTDADKENKYSSTDHL